MRSNYTLSTINFKTKHQTLVEYFNFTSTKTFSTHSKKSKIINNDKLAKNMTLKMFKEMFSTSDEKNEQIIEQFAEEYEIRRE